MGGSPSELSEREIFVIFDVIESHGSPSEAREMIHERLRVPPSNRKTIAAAFNVGVELFSRDPNSLLSTQEADEITAKARYGVSRSRVVELHRLYGLWRAHKQGQTGGNGTRKEPEGIAKTFESQLFTPPPEAALIDDLGSLGDCRLRVSQDILKVVTEDVGYTAGIKEIYTRATWGFDLPVETEIFWTVLRDGSVNRYCPIERDERFKGWLASEPRPLLEEFDRWKRTGGIYLADCRDTRRKIHSEAAARTGAAPAQAIRQTLLRLFSPPPQPLTVHFGDLVYQLAVEYSRSSGARGLPPRELYLTRPASLPLFDEIVLGQARIHLATTLPGLVMDWINVHRDMIVQWARSLDIHQLVGRFEELRHMEAAIRAQLHSAESG